MNNSWISKAITAFSTYFAKNYRITLILFLVTIILGFMSYTTFLKREGNPAVEVPIVIIQTPYFVNDVEKINEEITTPIEKAVEEVSGVKKVQSQTSENFSVVIVSLNQDVSSEDGAKNIRTELSSLSTLPTDAKPEIQTVSAGAIDGVHDILIALYGDKKSLDEITLKAKEVAEELSKLTEIKDAEAVELFKEQTSPITKKSVEIQTGYNRIGKGEKGDLVFQDAINIGLIKDNTVGLIDASDAIHKEIDKLKDDGMLDGFEISYGGDFAIQNKKSISGLESNALTALIAVAIILFLFLNWRASIVAIFFIPTVMAATFASLYLIGYDLNFIVLFGVILVLGLLVDDAIVVVEAIDYHKRKGEKGLSAVKNAISDVGVADMMGTVTTLLVFAPMAMISGILGDYIRFIPVTVMIALVLSLVIALSFTSFMSRWLIPNYKAKSAKVGSLKNILNTFLYGFGNIVRKVSDKIGEFVNYYLSKPYLAVIVFIISFGLIVAGGVFASKLKLSIFAPPKDSDEMIMTATFPSGISVSEAESVAHEVEGIIIEEEGENIVEVNYMASNETMSFMYLQLTSMKDRERTSKEIADNLNSKFKDYDKASVKARNGITGPPESDYQFFVQVYSEDQTKLERVTADIQKFIDNKEIKDGEKSLNPQVDNLSLIVKSEGKRSAQVKAKSSDPDDSSLAGELQNQIKKEFNKEKLKTYGLDEDALDFDQGLDSELMGSFNSAIFALIAAIAVMYLLLVIQYNSFALPFLILLAIPFTFAGLFPGLYFTGNAMSFFVMIGIIALSGIVVNNTILLVDFTNKRRDRGMGIRESISEAVKIRFRPIVITSVTTIVALIPLSLDPFWEGLTYSIIFGLIASTVLVVTAFPVYYAVIEKFRGWKNKLKNIFVRRVDS